MNGVCGGSAVQVERGGGGTTFVSAVERDMDCLPRTPTGGFLAALRSRSIFDTSGSLMPAPGRVLSENTKRNECKGRLQMACVQQVGVQMACVQQVGGVGQMGEQHLTPPLRRLRFLGRGNVPRSTLPRLPARHRCHPDRDAFDCRRLRSQS